MWPQINPISSNCDIYHLTLTEGELEVLIHNQKIIIVEAQRYN